MNLSVAPLSTGTVTGSGAYLPNAVVSVAAVANPGYVFSSWNGDFAGKPAAFTTTLTGPVTSIANFGEDTADDDGDGLTNYEEVVLYQTLPNSPDSDGDLIPDGDEVKKTFTSPTTSDASLVSFIRQNLSGSTAGGIALSPVLIERNPTTGAVSLSLSLKSSADRKVWQAVNLNQSPASIVPSGDGWNITFPAPSNAVNSYIIKATAP